MSTEPAPWFRTAITDGLKGLTALRLDGTPAADLIKATRDVWVNVLWPGRDWQQQLDTDRIHKGFLQLAANATRWPAPAEFRAYLPKRQLPTALPPPQLSKEQQRANLARIRVIVADVLTPSTTAKKS